MFARRFSPLSLLGFQLRSAGTAIGAVIGYVGLVAVGANIYGLTAFLVVFSFIAW